MPQLTIYLDTETQRKLTLAAKRESISLSSWARKQLAKAADISKSSAWDHISLLTDASGNDFEPPNRKTAQRYITEL